ncbi:metal-sensitive transcriptional regulator [Paenisporosarcina sp. NPDC076898]|uniref:metal-sensitive transcriptional regulator n=2 Tax=unclassified Paenisporosarcina TaxID=2642018 RepID=UPI003D05AD5D
MKEDTPVRSETDLHYDKTMINRLKRLEGQVRGVIRMMEEGKDCREVVTQLSAVRSASDRTLGLIVAKNLEHCIIEANEKGTSTETAIQEAVSMLVKSR